MSRGLYRVQVTVSFVNGAACTASLDEGNITTMREIDDVFARVRKMVEQMDPARRVEQQPWKPHVVNE